MTTLDFIFQKIAVKVLGEPGTLVERMGSHFCGVVTGCTYKVLNNYGCVLLLENGIYYSAGDFKKASQ